jgi:hypothetical protein
MRRDREEASSQTFAAQTSSEVSWDGVSFPVNARRERALGDRCVKAQAGTTTIGSEAMKLTMNRVFFVPVLVGQLALGTVACSGTNDLSDPTSESSASTHAQAYDGQTIFRAVFFNQGAAADKVAAMWADRPELAAGKSSEEVATLLDRAADEMASQSYSDASVKMVRSHAESLRSGATTPADLKSKGAIGAVADAIVAHIEKSNPAMFASFQA